MIQNSGLQAADLPATWESIAYRVLVRQKDLHSSRKHVAGWKADSRSPSVPGNGQVIMQYEFLVDTYRTERLKVLGVWSMFRDEHLGFRPHPEDGRGRSVREQMVHQCVSEDLWFRTMLGIDVAAPALPKVESRLGFMETYAKNSLRRLEALRSKPDAWWSEVVPFFDVPRNRAWIVVRRIAHTAHHRGQQTAMLRMLRCDLHSTYGPTADTGGLMQNHAPVIYAYPDVDALLEGEHAGGGKTKLPGPGDAPATERP